VLRGHLGQGLAVELLVALDDEFHVHRKARRALDHGLHAHDLGVVLALVFVRPARPDRAVLDPRRKRRFPEIDRVQGCTSTARRSGPWARGIHDPLGEEAGVGPVGQTSVRKPRDSSFSCRTQGLGDVRVPLLVGADAGNADELHQLVDERFLVFWM